MAIAMEGGRWINACSIISLGIRMGKGGSKGGGVGMSKSIC